MRHFANWTILGLTLTFLIGPFIIIILAGASAGQNLAFPPEGLSLKWYLKVFTIESFRASFALSMGLAVFGTMAALVLGIPAAYALNRYDLPGAETVRTIVAAPIIVPGIIVGLALLRYMVLPLNVSITVALFMAHTALVLPYAVRVVSSSMHNLRADMEEAAVLLGATRFQAFAKVVLPNIRGGAGGVHSGFCDIVQSGAGVAVLVRAGGAHAANRHACLYGNHLRPVGGGAVCAVGIHVACHCFHC